MFLGPEKTNDSTALQRRFLFYICALPLDFSFYDFMLVYRHGSSRNYPAKPY
jgi:hypothetical protein